MKKEYITLAIAIIGLSLYLFWRPTDRTHYEVPQLALKDVKNVTGLVIKGPEETVVAKKESGHWVLGDKKYPADEGKIKNLLQSLEDIELTALVSESKNYVRYDLDDAHKINVTAEANGATTLQFDLGKTAGSMAQSFVRPADDERVYQSRTNLRDTFDVDTGRLRNKIVLKFDIPDVTALQIARVEEAPKLYNKKEITPEEKKEAQEDTKKEDAPEAPKQVLWETGDGEKADKEKVEAALSTLSSLRCESYIPDESREKLTTVLHTINIDLKDGSKRQLKIYPKVEEQFPAENTDMPYPFYLSGWQVDRLIENLLPGVKAKNDPEETEPAADVADNVDKP